MLSAKKLFYKVTEKLAEIDGAYPTVVIQRFDKRSYYRYVKTH